MERERAFSESHGSDHFHDLGNATGSVKAALPAMVERACIFITIS